MSFIDWVKPIIRPLARWLIALKQIYVIKMRSINTEKKLKLFSEGYGAAINGLYAAMRQAQSPCRQVLPAQKMTSSNEKLKISLIINTYNRMHTLPNTLNALQFLRYPELEVIVVNGPSTDGTGEYLEKYWADKVKICTCPEANLSKSRNIGVAHAAGDIVCFTDDDGIPEPDWLDQLIVAYRDPLVAAAGGWVRNHTGVEYQTKYIVSSRDATSETSFEEEGNLPEIKAYSEKFPALIGVNSSFRRQALVEIGGFDEEYAYLLEETDVVLRLVDAGYHIKIIPGAEVHHKYASSHLRTSTGMVRSWLQISVSTAYYIIQNAIPTTSFDQCLEMIDRHTQYHIAHTNHLLAQQLIDVARHQVLMQEISEGTKLGIRDAFAFPHRRLQQFHQTPQVFKQFPRCLPAEERLHLALISRDYPPQECKISGLFIYFLAKALAQAGHEITVITEAAKGVGHTVDLEEGVWVHRIPAAETSAKTFAKTAPKNYSIAKKDLLSVSPVTAEIARMQTRRQFHFIAGQPWDLPTA